MKSHTEYLTFHTHKKREYINITDKVASALKKSGIQEGFALVGAMHITAGVYINDAEEGLIADIDEWLGKLPRKESITAIIAPARSMAMRILRIC
jgi:thiamine phosphate synthase YjbQ (UPF0047 family)